MTLALVILREFIQSIVAKLCVRRFVTDELDTPVIDRTVGTIGSAAVSSVGAGGLCLRRFVTGELCSAAVSSVGPVAEKSLEASIEMGEVFQEETSKMRSSDNPMGSR